MDELRFVRREDLALIVANDADDEFRLLIDEAILAELKHLARKEPSASAAKIRPREIQALLRAGHARAEVASRTGLSEEDVERYEEPVLAERRYIQERADAVLVRADSTSDAPQQFGEVIAARLEALEAELVEWSTWREDGEDWSVAVDFIAKDNTHRAVWSFDHRKGILAPESPDAVNLSQQGEIGDQLIPKLRAVDDSATNPAPPSEAGSADAGDDDSQVSVPPTTPIHDRDGEYERRREIDQRAVSSDDSDGSDLSQTADLLNALRERRGQREKELEQATERHPSSFGSRQREETRDASPTRKTPNLWSVPGVGNSPAAVPAEDNLTDDASEYSDNTDDVSDTLDLAQARDKQSSPRKGRASVPSWDDILFGTRSDEDPS